jgi:hypothetical protein
MGESCSTIPIKTNPKKIQKPANAFIYLSPPFPDSQPYFHAKDFPRKE